MSINIKKIITRIISSFIPNKELRKKIRSRIIFFNTSYNNLPIDIKLDVVSDLDRENAINKINNFKNTLNTIDTNKYRIVSLGTNCFVRTTLQGYGLLTKPANCIDGTEGDGHPGSLVFDLISTPIDCINQLLENNFEGYFDDLVFIEKHKWWRNTKYGFDFAHDLDCDNSEEGKVKLINRYKQRIQRFEKVFNTDQELIFVRYEYIFKKDLLLKLYENIKKRIGNKKLHFIIINVDLNFREDKISNDIYLINATQPCLKYVWHEEKYKFTEEGLKFERDICDKVRDYIKTNVFNNKI